MSKSIRRFIVGTAAVLAAGHAVAQTAPSVTISEWPINSFRAEFGYSPNGSCSHPGGPITVSVAGTTASGTCYSNGYWEARLFDVSSLPDGTVEVIVTHGPAGGPFAQATRQVVKDTVAPDLFFTFLPDITVDNQHLYGFTGLCDPAGGQLEWGLYQAGVTSRSGYVTCESGGFFGVQGQDMRFYPDGAVTAYIRQEDAAGNFARIEQVVSKSIVKYTHAIDFPPITDKTYTPDPVPFPAAVVGGGPGPVSFTMETPAVCEVGFGPALHLRKAGTCTITAYQNGNDQYAAATPITRTFTVHKATQVISFEPVGQQYLGGAPFAVYPKGSGSGPGGLAESLTPSVCSVNLNLARALALGTCTLRANHPGDDRYLPASGEVSFSIVQPPLGLTYDFNSMDFGPQSLNTISGERVITLTNHGPIHLTISQLAINGPFVATHDCTLVPAGSSCRIRGTFRPTADGVATGSLVISYNSVMSPTTFSLHGTGERSLVTHFYSAILGRNADAGGYAFWSAEAGRLQALGANMNEAWFAMALSFFNSAEYRASQPLHLDYLFDLYLTFFNRTPDEAGLAYWSGLLQQGLTRENVLQSFLFSPEFDAFTRGLFGNQSARPEAEMLMDFYRGTMGRLPDSAGYDFWLGRLRTAQCTSAAAVAAESATITQLFLTSPEYLARARGDAEYVSDLYNTFMRRGGDLAGQQYWVSQLQAGVTRDAVRLAFIGSPEFQARVQAVIAAGCL